MAGVKISQLTKYNEAFPDNNFVEDISYMIIPVTFGNKTVSLTLKEFIDLSNILLINNRELINTLANKIKNGEADYDDEDNDNNLLI